LAEWLINFPQSIALTYCLPNNGSHAFELADAILLFCDSFTIFCFLNYLFMLLLLLLFWPSSIIIIIIIIYIFGFPFFFLDPLFIGL